MGKIIGIDLGYYKLMRRRHGGGEAVVIPQREATGQHLLLSLLKQ